MRLSTKIASLIIVSIASICNIYAQTKDIVVLDAVTKQPIPNVSVKLKDSKAGTISQNDGTAKIHQSIDGQITLSHINYSSESISAKEINGRHVIYLQPRSNREIEEITIRRPLDDKWIGRWKLKSYRTIYIDQQGKPIGKSSKSTSGNIKEYKRDRSFVITNGSSVQLLGTYTTNNSQVIEKIKHANAKFLNGITNILTYFPDPQNEKRMVVQYQLPNQSTITEEVWEKLKRR